LGIAAPTCAAGLLLKTSHHVNSHGGAVANDPVGSGLVAGLARPGGNVTGLSIQAPELAGKRLELLRAVVHRLDRLAIMGNAGNPSVLLEMREVQGTMLARTDEVIE
jgi:ABC-type uncharacterized transport system substrate-binding protein